MATLTVRDLPDDVHRALRVRAAEHGRSTEAEARAILTETVQLPGRHRIGDALAALGQELGLTEADCALLDSARERKPAEPIDLA